MKGVFTGDLSGIEERIAHSYIIIKGLMFKTGGIENSIFDVYDREWNAEITDEKIQGINITLLKPTELGCFVVLHNLLCGVNKKTHLDLENDIITSIYRKQNRKRCR